MAERGATPAVSPIGKALVKAARALTNPLSIDDYLEMVNPLWSTRELRGRVDRICRETEDAVTIYIKPGWEWDGHEPGQYLRIGLEIDGRHHWRAYSLTSDPGRPDGLISITPKVLEEGQVSPFLNRQLQPGTIVKLGGVEGVFTLPDPRPEHILFISAGSGITPVMSMLRALAREEKLTDVVHLHSARNADDVIFNKQLDRMQREHDGYRLEIRHTADRGRMKPTELDELCPDWRDRETFACGPGEMLDALTEHWEREADCDKLHMERFQPVIGGDAGDGEGGTITFAKSGKEAECDGGTPILEAGENAGLELPFGCRMGICHTCTGRLTSGKLRDLRSGEVSSPEGQQVRTCIHAPEGPVEIEL